jgi:hypothetical protein
MTWFYPKAERGNIAQTAEIDLPACHGECVLALGFGRNAPAAAHHCKKVSGYNLLPMPAQEFLPGRAPSAVLDREALSKPVSVSTDRVVHRHRRESRHRQNLSSPSALLH